MSEVEVPQGRTIGTDSGAYIEGSVDTGGGDFVSGDKVVHIHQGENLRDKELAYLDGLLKRYEYWLDHYTPLAGIAEVRAAVKDGPRLDLPMPFIPRGFEKLIEHGYGAQEQVEQAPVDDLREAIAERQHIILLGDPGSGKTTTLWRLAYDYALVSIYARDCTICLRQNRSTFLRPMCTGCLRPICSISLRPKCTTRHQGRNS